MPARRRHLPRRRAQEAINVLLFLGIDSHKDWL
jgi:hypothetical protein